MKKKTVKLNKIIIIRRSEGKQTINKRVLHLPLLSVARQIGKIDR